MGGVQGHHHQSLLGLSNLHSAFGHTSEALNALGEAMSIAQHAGDQLCLGGCLATLQKLMLDAPGAPGLPSLGLGSFDERTGHWGMFANLLSRYVGG